MSKTACIVNPGRAVRHEGKRHAEGAVLHLDQADVKQLTANGFVSIWAPEQAPPASGPTDAIREGIDNFLQALTDGQVTEGTDSTLPKVNADKQHESSAAPDAKSSAPAPAPAPEKAPAPAKAPAAKTPKRRS